MCVLGVCRRRYNNPSGHTDRLRQHVNVPSEPSLEFSKRPLRRSPPDIVRTSGLAGALRVVYWRLLLAIHTLRLAGRDATVYVSRPCASHEEKPPRYWATVRRDIPRTFLGNDVSRSRICRSYPEAKGRERRAHLYLPGRILTPWQVGAS